MKRINSINKVSSNSSISEAINKNSSTLIPPRNETDIVSASVKVSEEAFREFGNDSSFQDFIKEQITNKLIKELLPYVDFEKHTSEYHQVEVTGRLKVRNLYRIPFDLDKSYYDGYIGSLDKCLDKMRNWNWEGVNNY